MRTVRLLFATCLTALACAAPRSLYMGFGPVRDGEAPLVDSLVVKIVGDERPLKGRTSVGPGFLALIPFVPYGHQQLPPDRLTGDFLDDVAKTLTIDLRAANVSNLVIEEGDQLPGQAAPTATHRLLATVTEGTLHRRVTAYGLSFAGALAWFVGAPVSWGSAEIGLRTELRDPRGASLGSQEFRGEAGFKEGLYYNPFAPTGMDRLRDAYVEISPGIRSFVRRSLAGGERHAVR